MEAKLNNNDLRRKKFDRGEFKVSSSSFWSDERWQLENSTPGFKVPVLNWNFILPNGESTLDPKYDLLLESFKEVFWGMLNFPTHYGRVMKSGTTGSFSAGMRDAFRWMVNEGLQHFGELTPCHLEKFKEELPYLLTNRARFYNSKRSISTEFNQEEIEELEFPEEWHETAEIENLEDDETFTIHQVSTRIMIWYYIFAQIDHLADQALPLMNFRPFGTLLKNEVSKSIIKRVWSRIPPLPNEVAMPLLNASIDWLHVKGPAILKIQDAFLKKQSICDSRILKKNTLLSNLFEKFSDEFPQGEVWAEKKSFRQDFKGFNESPTQALRHFIMHTQTAVMIILQYLVGLRISEVASIKEGWNYETNLPSCVEIKHSKSGVMEMFYLNGILSKHLDIPIAEQWLLGSRPVGAKELPLTLKALCLLQELMQPWRELGEVSNLFVTFSQPKSLPQVKSSIGKLLTGQLLRGLRQFIYSQVDLSLLPDISSTGEDLIRYKDSKGSCIQSHQGRKTFAAYVIETRSSTLPAVSQHFKHMSIAMTESSYFSTNTRFKDLTEELRISETTAFFVEAVQGKKIKGRMAELVEKYFGDYEWQNFNNAAELEMKVSELVITHDLRIFFSEHGNCLIRSNPLASRCNELSGGAAWHLVTPNWSTRSPDLCVGCGCFVMDASHLPYWKSKKEELSKVVLHSENIESVREFRVHQLRLGVATKIVSHIQGENQNE